MPGICNVDPVSPHTLIPRFVSAPVSSGRPVLDVVVVGAGVSGLYSAMRLSQKYDFTVHVFDANNRIGGRTYSLQVPGITDFKAEVGAMRFKKTHLRLNQLIRELGLTVQPFPTASEDNTLYYLRGELLDKADIETGRVPYNMTDEERALVADTDALVR